MIGKKLDELGFTEEIQPKHYSVKESVFPFIKFVKVDTILGPEMKSTGEVMGIDPELDNAFAKSQIAAGNSLPLEGVAFISVKDEDKNDTLIGMAKKLAELDFDIICTGGTSKFLTKNGIVNKKVNKVSEGRPDITDYLKNNDVHLLINTTFGEKEVAQSYSIRRNTLIYKVPYFTTIAGAKAAVGAIESIKKSGLEVKAIQDY